MRIEFFLILIAASLICIVAGFKQRMGLWLIIAGVFFLATSSIVYAEGLDLETGFHKQIYSVDANLTDYDLNFTAYTPAISVSSLFLFWMLFIFGVFFIIFGLYTTVSDFI